MGHSRSGRTDRAVCCVAITSPSQQRILLAYILCTTARPSSPSRRSGEPMRCTHCSPPRASSGLAPQDVLADNPRFHNKGLTRPLECAYRIKHGGA